MRKMGNKIVESGLLLVCLFVACLASAQMELQSSPAGVPPLPPPGAGAGPVFATSDGAMGFSFVAAEPLSAKVVKGAPYSAEATIESTQSLPDGNRIVHRQTVHLYRDSQGRTRREETLAAIGPWASQGTPPTIVTIQDPKAGAAYVLNPQNKTAHKLRGPMGAPSLPGIPGGDVVFGTHSTTDGNAVGNAGVQVMVDGNEVTTSPMSGEVGMLAPRSLVAVGTSGTRVAAAQGNLDKKVEALGQEDIAGVSAAGTRTSITIPANAIGNEQPLIIVNDKWSSQELQIVLRTKQSDPRFGETTYEVTALDRAEPSHTLFELPPDYKLTAAPALPFPPGMGSK
jgi:hypothetical protein